MISVTAKYTFLINPESSSGNGNRVWNIVERELKKRSIEYDVIFTTPDCGATDAAFKLTSDNECHTLIVLGGDGTIDEVVNGVNYLEKLTLGYIPTGSGNDFTRALNLPTDPLTALDVILNHGRTVNIDIGVSSFGDETRRFAVSAGIGFDASVCHRVEKTKLKSILNRMNLGNLIYGLVALKEIFCGTLVDAEIVLDGSEPIHFSKMFFAAVMNHPYEGGGFFFCPAAKVDDALLDVLVVSNISRIKALALLPTALFGKHTKFSGINIYQCNRIEISTDKPLPIHTDGEPVAVSRSLKAEVCKKQMFLIAP